MNDEHENTLGSASLYIWNYCYSVVAKNNIFVNDGFNASGTASSIYDNYSTSNLKSDRNDLYFQPYFGNCLVNIAGTHYETMEDWQKTGNDSNSISEMPHFIDGDLHIDASISTNLESHGIPLDGIDVDFDWSKRRTDSTDIGADEFDGSAPSSVEGVGDITFPTAYVLNQNYPNPFNPSTTIQYELPKQSFVTMKIFDVLGREVAVLVNEKQGRGTHSIVFNANSLQSGIYFCRLTAGSFSNTKKMLLVK